MNIHLLLPTMSCEHCRKRIEHALQSLEGVESSSVNLENKTVDVQGTIEPDTLIETIKNLGYEVKL